MSISRTVTVDEIAQVIHLRDKEGLQFADIAARMGWPRVQRAGDIYHYYKGRKLTDGATIRAGNVRDNSPIGGPGNVPDRIPADHAITRADAPPPSPSAKRYLSAIADDIAVRIQRQGITAGLLGDPPKGRSALDRKMMGVE